MSNKAAIGTREIATSLKIRNSSSNRRISDNFQTIRFRNASLRTMSVNTSAFLVCVSVHFERIWGAFEKIDKSTVRAIQAQAIESRSRSRSAKPHEMENEIQLKVTIKQARQTCDSQKWKLTKKQAQK